MAGKIYSRNPKPKKSYSGKFNSERIKSLGKPLIKKGFRTATKTSTQKSRNQRRGI